MLVALVLGLALGAILVDKWPQSISIVIPVADVTGGTWLDALRMTIVPLVFALVVSGTASTAGMTSAGGLTGRSIASFIILLSIAAVGATLVAPAVLAFLPPPADASAALREGLGVAPDVPPSVPFDEMLLGIVPSNPIAAAAEGAMLPLVIFAVVFGLALAKIEKNLRDAVTETLAAVAETMFVVVRWILLIAPLGIFGLAVAVGARTGIDAFGALVHYVAFISGMCLLLVFGAYVLAVFIGRLNAFEFAVAAAPAQAVAISTQSSLASLPVMMDAVRNKLNVDRSVADVTLPLAVSLFRIASPVANICVALYVAAVLGLTVEPLQLVYGAFTAVVMGFAAVGVASQVSYFAVLSPILLSMGIPLEMLAILIAVESIPDIFRTVANVTTDMAVTAVVARFEKGSVSI